MLTLISALRNCQTSLGNAVHQTGFGGQSFALESGQTKTQCLEKFQWSRDNPGPTAGLYLGSKNYYNELTTLGTKADSRI